MQVQHSGNDGLVLFLSEVKEKVYSMRSHTWRRLKGFRYFIRDFT